MTSETGADEAGAAGDGDPGGADQEPLWRIDELAHRSGVPVDTIRYYQREGLLARPTRRGRAKYYGPAHLVRLEQIRALQDRRFSLAAIGALLDADQPGLIEGLFGARRDRSYTATELAQLTGADGELIAGLEEAGALRDPVSDGRHAFDTADLDLVTAIAELERLGLPRDLLLRLVAVYVTGFEQIQRQVIELISAGSPGWDEERVDAFRIQIASVTGELLPRVEKALTHLHQRTLQRMTLETIAARSSPAEPGPD